MECPTFETTPVTPLDTTRIYKLSAHQCCDSCSVCFLSFVVLKLNNSQRVIYETYNRRHSSLLLNRYWLFYRPVYFTSGFHVSVRVTVIMCNSLAALSGARLANLVDLGRRFNDILCLALSYIIFFASCIYSNMLLILLVLIYESGRYLIDTPVSRMLFIDVLLTNVECH